MILCLECAILSSITQIKALIIPQLMFRSNPDCQKYWNRNVMHVLLSQRL